MIAFLLLFVSLGRLYRNMFKQPETRALLIMAIVVLMIGVVFYTNVEHWSVVNAIYFCVVTLGTVGYGDITPTTDVGKLFTVFYIIFGLGVIGGFFATLGRLIDPQQFLLFKRPLQEAAKVQEELTHVIHHDEAAETRKDDKP
jgi:voltage-gated potassium channel